jgi:anti-sigma regulatory factor (Ser/Thr protein kinase)
MSYIILEPNATDSLGHQLTQLSRIIQLANAGPGDYTLDFKNIRFMHPTVILGASSIITSLNKRGKSCKLLNVSQEVQFYLNTVSFPTGILPDLDTRWAVNLERYRHKNYLPIISFSTNQDTDATNFRNEVLSKVNELVAQKLELQLSDVGYISYFISEFTDNIVEHSNASRGKIMLQYFPTKQYLEICILDDGITLQGAYEACGRYDVSNNKEAIKLAIDGHSAKSAERGYGIPTSTNLIVKGIGGTLFIVSGDGMLANQTVTSFPAVWGGTMLSIKIPKKSLKNWADFI